MTNSLSEIEDEILGTILIRSGAIGQVKSLITTPDVFTSDLNRKIYAVMLELSAESKETDMVTVNYTLNRKYGYTLGNDLYWMQVLTSYLPAAKRLTGNLASKCFLLHQEYIRLSLATILSKTLVDSQDVTSDPLQLIDELRNWLDKTRNSLNELSDQPFAKSLLDVAKRAQIASENKNPITGIPTGLSELDKFLKGLQRGTFTVMAGRPGSGKTAEACQIAYNVACLFKIPVAFFSLEMSKEQIATRFMAIDTGLKNSHITAGLDGHGEAINFTKLYSSASKLGESPLFVFDKIRTLPQLKAKVSQLKSKYPELLVIVDYLQLLRTGTNLDNNPVTRVSESSNQLKALSTDYELPVLALAQLSREVERRDDKRPMLADLKESGAIEQDADSVVFLFRPGYYSTTDKSGVPVNMNLLFNIIAKNRQGSTHNDSEAISLFYEPSTNQIKNW